MLSGSFCEPETPSGRFVDHRKCKSILKRHLTLPRVSSYRWASRWMNPCLLMYLMSSNISKIIVMVKIIKIIETVVKKIMMKVIHWNLGGKDDVPGIWWGWWYRWWQHRWIWRWGEWMLMKSSSWRSTLREPCSREVEEQRFEEEVVATWCMTWGLEIVFTEKAKVWEVFSSRTQWSTLRPLPEGRPGPSYCDFQISTWLWLLWWLFLTVYYYNDCHDYDDCHDYAEKGYWGPKYLFLVNGFLILMMKKSFCSQ